MKKLSIAMIVAQYPNIVQTYIVSMISGLQASGNHVSVIATRGHKPDNVSLRKIARLPDSCVYLSSKMSGILLDLLVCFTNPVTFFQQTEKLMHADVHRKYGWKYFIKAIARACRLADQELNILHSHNLTLSYEYLFLKELTGIPLVTTFHGKEPRGSTNLAGEKQQLLFDKGDLFIVNTNFAKHSLADMGCPTDKIFILPQGTNIQDFPFKSRQINPAEEITILTVGRLSAEKGQHIAIQAIRLLSQQYPNIRYHLIGNGPEKAKLQQLITQSGLEEHVILHGYADSDELNSLYQAAHIFILPSIDLKDDLHVETQGVVIQEAQASGIPVIASRTGGIPEVVVDNKTALLFTEGQADELAARIEQLLTHPELYNDLQTNARQHVETSFSHTHICDRLLARYHELLETGRSRLK